MKMKYVFFILSLITLCAEGSQQASPTEWIAAPEQGDKMYYLAQRTTDAKLVLTANESFFPNLGLLATGLGEFPVADDTLNKGENFAVITQWASGDAAVWGLWFEQSGKVDLRVFMDHSSGDYVLSLDGQQRTFTTQSDGTVLAQSFTVKKTGMHVLRMACKKESEKAQLRSIELSGLSVKRAAVLRKRWRPSAAHARFSSSSDPDGVQLVIMEMDAKPGPLDTTAPLGRPTVW